MAHKPELIRVGSQKYEKLMQGETPVLSKGLAAGATAMFQGMSDAAKAAAIKVAAIGGRRASIEDSMLQGGETPTPSIQLPKGAKIEDSMAAAQNTQFWKEQEFKDYVKNLHATQGVPDQRQEDVSTLQNWKDYADKQQAPTGLFQPVSMPGGLSQEQISQATAKVPSQETGPHVLQNVIVNPRMAGKLYRSAPTQIENINKELTYRGNPLGGLRKDVEVQIQQQQAARQPFDLNGQPLETDVTQAVQIQQIKNAYAGHDFQAQLAVDTFKIESFLSKAVNALGLPAKATMLLGTEDNPSLLGATINFAQNALMAVGSDIYLKGILPLVGKNPDVLDKQADALEASILDGTYKPTPGARGVQQPAQSVEELRSTAQYWRNAYSNAIDWFNRYAQGAHNSWGDLVGQKWNPEKNALVPPPLPQHSMTPKEQAKFQQAWQRYQDAVGQSKALMNLSGQEASTLYKEASEATDPDAAKIYANAALDAQVKKLEYQRKTDPLDHFGSYTWQSEPARYDSFMRDVAFFELQVGRDATPSEIERIKDHHVNMFTDGVGQAVFDPVWLLQPGAEALVKGTLTITGKGLQATRAVDLAIPARAMGIIKDAEKTIKPVDDIYRFFFQEAHSSAANAIGRTVYDTLDRMRPQYKTGADFIADVDGMAADWPEIDRILQTQGHDAAEAAFNELKANHAGWNSITFDDWKHFTDGFKANDGTYLLEPGEWGKALSDGMKETMETRRTQALMAASRAGEDIRDPAVLARADKAATEWVNDANKSGEYISALQGKAEQAFLDPYRAFPGSRLVTDTVSGKIAQKLFADGHKDIAYFMNGTTGMLIKVRNVWSNAVLNLNPARVIRNLFDSMGRDMIYGGSAWEDLGTLFANTQLHFVNDVGFIPVEFGQSLARAGLDFSESVPTRLLYSDKPMFGVFSYWDFEAKRMQGEALMKGVQGLKTEEEIAAKLAEMMPKGVKGFFQGAWDGFRFHMNLGAISGALADYNTAIEFTLRLRMFHRSYFELMKTLEPEFAVKGMENLSPQAKALAKEVWEMSKSNPAKMAAYVDSLTGRVEAIDKMHPEWSFSLPEDFGKGMDNPEVFRTAVRSETENFITNTVKTKGRLPSADEVDAWIADAKSGIREETLQRMNRNPIRADAGQDLGTEIAKQPKADELQGATKAMTTPPPPVSAKVAAFRKGKLPPAATVDAYSEAMTNYAKVTHVKGDQVVARVINGDVTIEVGDALLAGKNNAKLYKGLHEATIRAFALKNEEMVYGLGMDINRWTNEFRGFLSDPVRALNEHERSFVTFVMEMDENPDVYSMLQKTGKVQNYEQAAKLLRDNGTLQHYKDMPINEYIGFVQRQEHIAHPRAYQYLRNGQDLRIVGGKTSDAMRLHADPDFHFLFNGAGKVQDSLQGGRDKLETFYRYIFPGYFGKSNEARRLALNNMDNLVAREYAWEAGFKQSLLDRLATEPDAVKAELSAIPLDQKGFAQWFLDKAGIKAQYDEKGMPYAAKLLMEGGEAELNPLQVSSLRKLFFEGVEEPVRQVVTLAKDGTQVDRFRAMTNAFATTLGMKQREAGAMSRMLSERAKWWVEMGGGTEEEYLARYGWETVNGKSRLLLTGKEKGLLTRGMVAKDPTTGLTMFYGTGSHDLPSFMRQSSQIFYNDLAELAAKHPDSAAAESLRVIDDFLGVKVSGKANPLQLEKFQDAMMGYTLEGKLPPGMEKMKTPLESFSRSLDRTYRGILGEENLLHLPNDVMDALNQNHIARTLAEPPSMARRTSQVMAHEAGINTTPDAILREVNRAASRRVGENASLRDYIAKEYGTNISDELRQKLVRDLGPTMNDPMTGVETIRSMAQRPVPGGWVYANSDFNGLKPINDVFGHEKGDEVLKKLGAQANEAIAAANAAAGEEVARVYRGGTGADEFFYRFKDKATADQVMADIDARIKAITLDVKGETKTGFSVGFGVGTTKAEAESGLEASKAKALEEGRRALRGEMPISVVTVGKENEAPASFVKWYGKEYETKLPDEIQHAWETDAKAKQEFLKATGLKKAPEQPAFTLKYPPMKGEYPDNITRFPTLSVNEMPGPLGDRVRNEAQKMLGELRAGTPGERILVNATEREGLTKVGVPTSNPEWYSALHQGGHRKPGVEKALQRIIDGNGDKGKLSQLLKDEILSRFQGQAATKTAEGVAPDLYALHLLGAKETDLRSSLEIANELYGNEAWGVLEGMKRGGASDAELEDYLQSLNIQANLTPSNMPGLAPAGVSPVAPEAPVLTPPSAPVVDRRGAPRVYSSLDEVPLEERARAIKRMGGNANTQIDKQLQQAWDTWKTRRDFVGFPADAMKDPIALKKYLKTRYMNSQGEMAADYARKLWDVEAFENSILNYHTPKSLTKSKDAWEVYATKMDAEYKDLNGELWTKGITKERADEIRARMVMIDDTLRPDPGKPNLVLDPNAPPRVTDKDIIGDMLFPKVPKFHQSQGVQMWMDANAQNMSEFEAMEQELSRLGQHLKSGAAYHQVLPAEVKAELQAWKTQAVANKSQLISLGLNGGDYGGRTIEGAVQKTNRVMLDYSYRTRFDNFMRNFFPFWQFPSRSWPFWIETLSSKPEIVAAYAKMQNISKQARYQAGAVTSTGKPLPSLNGYAPIPGTDLWFNPLAPLSFAYVLGMQASPDNILYQSSDNQDDIPPAAALANEFLSMGQIYGFNAAPWTTYLAKKAFGITDAAAPQYPLLPQIPLMPRWLVADLVDKANKASLLGSTGWGDMLQSVYPEVNWHDFLVERQMLEEANQNLPNMDEMQARKYINDISQAIKQKGDNPLWKAAYQEYTSTEASRSQRSFFTGFFTKPFTDTDADMLRLRNENNLMKSSMNNKFQAAIFDLPTDANESWNRYLNQMDTPEGWLYRLYTDIGWVRNADSQTVSDPKERAQLLAQKITEDEKNNQYYLVAKQLQNRLNFEMMAVPVGADWATQVQPILDRYYNDLSGASEKLYTPSGSYNTNKPVELIQQGLVNSWWRIVNHTKPSWNAVGGETYDQYQTRLKLWQDNLPKLASSPALMRYFTMQPNIEGTLSSLRPDQNIGENFISNLIANTNADTYQQWNLQNDTIFDALNNAWKSTYWEPYWEAHKDASSPTGWKQGAAYQLADYDFLAQHPEPPDADALYKFIHETYGDRFTPEEVRKWVMYDNNENVLSISQRQELTSQDPQWQQRQDIWNILSMLGPGKNRSIIENALDSSQYQDLQNWYNSGGSLWKVDPNKPSDNDAANAARLQSFHDALELKVSQMQLPQPTRADLVQFKAAEDANNQFHQLVSATLNRPWEDVNSILNTYYDMGSKAFRQIHPEDYNTIVQPYYTMRDSFAKTSPVWSSYYMWQQQPANTKGVIVPKPGPTPVQPVYKESLQEVNGRVSMARPAQQTAQTGTEFYKGVAWPMGLRKLLTPDLTYEITQKILAPDTNKISLPGQTFLKNLMATHPEWRLFITPLFIPPKVRI